MMEKRIMSSMELIKKLRATTGSGMLDFKIADIILDNKILHFARKEAEMLLKDDENLEKADLTLDQSVLSGTGIQLIIFRCNK